MDTRGQVTPEPVSCRFCGAEIEQQDTDLWETGGDTADARRHCTDGPAHLHEPALPAGTGEPEGTCNCQEPSPSPLNPLACHNCGYQLNQDQLALVGLDPDQPERCGECGQDIPGGFGVSRAHLTSCSLYGDDEPGWAPAGKEH